MSEKPCNSRYQAFQRATGGKARDSSYALWITFQWDEWRRENGKNDWEKLSSADHDAFDRWLAKKWPEPDA